jgi:hypothetical protein
MSHFAQITDNNNTVVNVVVIHNNDCLDTEGNESEAVGAEFCRNLFGGRWVQTSYNGNFRKNFAGIDYVFDETRDAFIPPKPFESWTLDETTCLWQAPTEMPDDGKIYTWDEPTLSWIEININPEA